jgi:methionyl-tRNA formyltransferase
MFSAPTHHKPSIVFFGSGPLAAESLAHLYQQFVVEAVITKPRAPHHGGTVPVIEFCDENGLRYFTPSSKHELTELFQKEKFYSQLGVVIDYGIIIAQTVIEMFPLGIINSHFSLLPEWRGADPITFAILSGQPATGVSLMLINDRMDEGPLLAQAECSITPETTAPALTEDLIEISNALLAEIIPHYVSGNIQPVPQTNSIVGVVQPSYSRRLTKQDGTIDWHKSAVQLEREVRAFIEWPKSRTAMGSVEVIITQAHAIPGNGGTAGKVTVDQQSGTLQVSCSAGSLGIDRLKPAGKKEMSAVEFIRGYASRIV